MEVGEIDERSSFTLSSLGTGRSEFILTASDDNGRRRQKSFPVEVVATEPRPRLRLLLSAEVGGATQTVSNPAPDSLISVGAAPEGAVPEEFSDGEAVKFAIAVGRVGEPAATTGDGRRPGPGRRTLVCG